MSLCPYTYLVELISPTKSKSSEAQSLKVVVHRDGQCIVDVTLPAHSARWLIDIMPDSVVEKVLKEGIPLHAIQDRLARMEKLYPLLIMDLKDENRNVRVWLE